MSEETREKVANAFRAMKSIGISADKVKPVLKSLLKLFDKNWKPIEEENYRALADAIFERDEVEAAERSRKTLNGEAAEHPKKIVNSEKEDCLEEEAHASEEPERPLKRLRHINRDGQTSTSNTSNTDVPKTPLVRPKEEPDELPEGHLLKATGSHGTVHPNAEKERFNSQADTCQSLGANKQEQHTSPKSLIVNETLSGTERRSPSNPMRLRDRGKGSVSFQSGEKNPVSGSSSDAACLKVPINKCGTYPATMTPRPRGCSSAGPSFAAGTEELRAAREEVQAASEKARLTSEKARLASEKARLASEKARIASEMVDRATRECSDLRKRMGNLDETVRMLMNGMGAQIPPPIPPPFRDNDGDDI